MASNYTGNPLVAQAPSPAPSLSADPIGSMPTDGDALNASSVLQALKVPLDWLAFLRRKVQPIKGVTTWDASATYVPGDMVIVTSLTYRVKSGGSPTVGLTPVSDLTNWEQWGHSTSDLVATLNATYPPSFSSGNALINLPAGIKLQVEYLDVSVGTLPVSTAALTHYFATPFSTACYGVFFQGGTIAYTSGAVPVLGIYSPGTGGCALTLLPSTTTGYWATGWLFSIGH